MLACGTWQGNLAVQQVWLLLRTVLELPNAAVPAATMV